MLPNSKVILSYFRVYAQLVRNLGLIDITKDVGVDAVKFQTFHVEDVIIKNAEKIEY